MSAMNIAVLVPVKKLDKAKMRMADTLDRSQRRQLMMVTLRRVLSALQKAQIGDVYLVASDPQVKDMACDLCVKFIPDQGDELNPSLELARGELCQNYDALLVVFGDLPMISDKDIKTIVRLGSSKPSCVIAPDKRNVGTNVLFLHPPYLLPFTFGGNSYERFRSNCEKLGVQFLVYQSQNTALDLDYPQNILDLAALRGHKISGLEEILDPGVLAQISQVTSMSGAKMGA